MVESTSMTVAERRQQAITNYRTRVTTYAMDFVTTMVGEEDAEKIARQFTLAFREAAQKNADLYSVPPQQVAWAVARSALTGLMPGGPLPLVDLIVRGGELNWQVSSRGWQKLGEDAGWHLEAVPVFEDDHFVWKRDGDKLHIEHRPDPWAEPDYNRLKGYLVIARDIHNRGLPSRYRLVPKAKIEHLRSFAQTQKVWNVHPMEMAEKAVKGYCIRRGMVPLTESSRRALVVDEMHAPPEPTIEVVEPDEVPPPANGAAGVAALVDDLDDSEVEPVPDPPPPPADPRQAVPEPEETKTVEPVDTEPDPLDEVRRLAALVPKDVALALQKKVNSDKPIRLRSYNPTVQQYEKELRAYLAAPQQADEESELPEEPTAPEPAEREPGDEAETATDGDAWEPENVEASIMDLPPSMRKKACLKARVACNVAGMPIWADVDDDAIQRLGNAIEQILGSEEAAG